MLDIARSNVSILGCTMCLDTGPHLVASPCPPTNRGRGNAWIRPLVWKFCCYCSGFIWLFLFAWGCTNLYLHNKIHSLTVVSLNVNGLTTPIKRGKVLTKLKKEKIHFALFAQFADDVISFLEQQKHILTQINDAFGSNWISIWIQNQDFKNSNS